MMSRKNVVSLCMGVAIIALAALPGESCGPFFTEAVFVSHRPASMKAILDGTQGLILPTFSTSDLALIYRKLTGPAFTVEERKQLTTGLVHPSQDFDGRPSEALAYWLDTRKKFTGQDLPANLAIVSTDAKVPGQDWQTYPNCLDDAFTNAARTFTDRMRIHFTAHADGLEWLKGQDAVFSNCAGTNPAHPGQMPQPLDDTHEDWLIKDRDYQIAAAYFYRGEWAKAKVAFEAVALDDESVLQDLASYMLARTMIRQATLNPKFADPGSFDPLPMWAAQRRLKALVADGGEEAQSAHALLSFVNLRLDPLGTANLLGNDIAKPDPRLQQDLIDLRYAVGHADSSKPAEAESHGDLIDWVLTMRESYPSDRGKHALQRWRQTRSLPWMIAAIMQSENTQTQAPSDAARPTAPTPLDEPAPPDDLVAAAKAITRTSSAWATITYNRLRLLASNPTTIAAARNELNQLFPYIEKTQPTSTINAFHQLAQHTAISLGDYIRLGAMQPASYIIDGDEEFASSPVAIPDAAQNTLSPRSDLPQDTPRFNLNTAIVLNEKLPLDSLAKIVLAHELPNELGFELSMAVWTRAVLLDKPEIAAKMTAFMVEYEPGWRIWLNAYDHATTASERKITGLLALMRFPSVRPYVNAGVGREEGFAGYSVLRDNWWCAGMGISEDKAESYSVGYNFDRPGSPMPPNQAKDAANPQYITPAMVSRAQIERAALANIGDAAAYFGAESLAWAKAHPSDPRGGQLLGFAFRAMRNGCNLEASNALRREVFDRLHKFYPNSVWAQKYPTFITDTQ